MSTNDANGLLVVISGPSGVGKTTIVHRVKETFNATFSVSATTRPKSESEENGIDYFFISDEAFDQMVKDGEFLEFAEVFGCHRYGTPKLPVLQAMERGEVVLLDIDVQGGIQVFENMPESLRIFIMPPHEDELLTRLRARGRDDEDAIQRRFREAKQEMAKAEGSGAYSAFIINDNLELAVAETIAIIRQQLTGQTTPS
ncbi:MAG: guanylate kinase [Phycisphaerales bacterium]|nr:guanylate kinase [Phycisphaerales bacterium]